MPIFIYMHKYINITARVKHKDKKWKGTFGEKKKVSWLKQGCYSLLEDSGLKSQNGIFVYFTPYHYQV